MRQPAPGLARVRTRVWCSPEDNWTTLGSLVCLNLSCHVFTHKTPKLPRQFATLGNRDVSESQRVIQGCSNDVQLPAKHLQYLGIGGCP